MTEEDSVSFIEIYQTVDFIQIFIGKKISAKLCYISKGKMCDWTSVHSGQSIECFDEKRSTPIVNGRSIAKARSQTNVSDCAIYNSDVVKSTAVRF